MRTSAISAAFAAVTMAATLTLNAQTPAPQQPASPQPQAERQQPATTAPRPMAEQAKAAVQAIVIAGCLKEEKDVPGSKPNVAERAGVSEDYILTNVKMSPASTVSGIALATRYEIEGISKDDLKKHLNHQVEITGTITQPAPAGNDETADFHGTSLKMVAATCAAQ